ncbi:MAG TPA: hypothetical protein PLO37_07600 [Candidatus Hydrogenedentes bacterium]|nr:hypothetical protein [Candidatus Hydrogenedentota bacterium]HPG66695.1 hypothetical protein [Candidatus Hydrogenedentota bacterium]
MQENCGQGYHAVEGTPACGVKVDRGEVGCEWQTKFGGLMTTIEQSKEKAKGVCREMTHLLQWRKESEQ